MSNVAIFVAHEGCPQRCSFCNQHLIAGQTRRVTADDVTKTLEKACDNPHHNEHQIAFFGGSFTAIERSYMKQLLDATIPFRSEFGGIRISTRPDAVDEEILALLHAYGVTAIELGAQSMDDTVLALNHRGHTAQDVADAAVRIRAGGFELGLQMMTGLYGDSDEKALATAAALATLQPDTMRIYPTVVLQGTELAHLYREGVYKPQTLEEAIELCVRLILFFDEQSIPIIRLGLHESEAVKSARVAGAYHPAFKELCLARLFYQKAVKLLADKPGGAYTVFVNDRCVSQMVGQNKENIFKLRNSGYEICVKPDASLGQRSLRIENRNTNQCI